MKKILGPVVSLVLLTGVGVAIYLSASEQANIRDTLEVTGLIGSEKQDFFDDEHVQQRLRELGLVVRYHKAGSRQIATSFDLSQYDFAFPAGLPAAEKIRQQHPDGRSFSPFFSPMVVASWEPIAALLVANRMAAKRGNHYTLDLRALLEAVVNGARWKDLAHNDVFAVNKTLLIGSTDIRKSNSAAMYLALVSYVLNGDAVVRNEAQMQAVLPRVSELFLRQGFLQNSSAAPFEDYLVMGMGKAPLVMIYEQQFIHRAALTNGGIRSGMVLMYPQPSLFTKHILIGLTEGGNRLGEALENDPELQRLAVQHGLRSTNVSYFKEFVGTHSIPVADNLVDIIEPPSYEIIEAMIGEIERNY